MAVVAQCDECGKTYKLKDTAAGKVFPCKACSADFRVPRRKSRRKPAAQSDDGFYSALDAAVSAESKSAPAVKSPRGSGPSAKPPRTGGKRKSGKKKAASDGGGSFPGVPFHLGKSSVFLFVIGGVLVFVGLQDRTLVSKSKAEPHSK